MAIPIISVEQKLFLVKAIRLGGIKGKQHLFFISLRMVYKEYSQSLFLTVLLALLGKFISRRATATAKKLQSLTIKQLIIIKSYLISKLLKNSTHYLIGLTGLIIFLL